MTNKLKIIIASVVVVAFIVVGFITFLNSKVEYASFADAKIKKKKVEVRGVVQKDKQVNYDAGNNTLTFYMKDEDSTEIKVVYSGAKPNNFDIATMIVTTGKMKDDNVFYASEILTKCPSKYEASGEDVNKQKSM